MPPLLAPPPAATLVAVPARVEAHGAEVLGAWRLTLRNRRFGGWSALAKVAPGRLLALSDQGVPMRLDVAGGRVAGRLLPPLGLGGAGKAMRDVESLARDPDGGLWLGVEQVNAVLRLDPALRLRTEAYPRAMAGWRRNGGPEAIARPGGGRLLVLAEDDGDGLLFAGDPDTAAPVRFRYRPPEGTRPSDAAALPDGGVLVLNRGIDAGGFFAVLTRLDTRRIGPGAVLTGRPLARFRADNLEGLAIDGRTAWLISDDNFLAAQRTLLIRIALPANDEGRPGQRVRTGPR